jgi:hypothetical protein
MYYKNRQYEDAIKPLKMAVSGGTADSGEVVKGLPLDYGRIAEYYFTYGLALADLGLCGDALPISQTLMEGVKNDEISVFNAQEIINICSGNPTRPEDINPVNTPAAGQSTPVSTPEALKPTKPIIVNPKPAGAGKTPTPVRR